MKKQSQYFEIILLMLFVLGLLLLPTIDKLQSAPILENRKGVFPPEIVYRNRRYRLWSLHPTRGLSDLEGYEETVIVSQLVSKNVALDLTIDGSTNVAEYLGGTILYNPTFPDKIILRYNKDVLGETTDVYIEMAAK